MSKPNCYNCVHRRDLVGDAHSRCAHPDVGNADALQSAMAILASVGRTGPVADIDTADKLNIECNPHGLMNGWFNWPYNFDPVWLVRCDGFTKQKG